MCSTGVAGVIMQELRVVAQKVRRLMLVAGQLDKSRGVMAGEIGADVQGHQRVTQPGAVSAVVQM